MVVELVVAISLPVWLCVEEIARIRAQRPRPATDREPTSWKPRREAALSAKA
jgi:hypothetical protein